jgi:plastocyanin
MTERNRIVRRFLTPLSALSLLAGFLLLTNVAAAATRIVNVGQGGNHFVDQQSGTSTSNINVGDTVQWTWVAGFHSTTSGTCSGPTCTPDGTWDSGQHSTPHMFSFTFNSAGTFPYYCSVHLSTMQGTVIVSTPGPPPTVSSVDPTSGLGTTGDPFTIAGTNFVSGASVSVGGVAATGVSVPDSMTISATTPVLSPGTLNDVTVTNPDTQSATLTQGWFADFLDVPQSDIFHGDVETIFRDGITAGCGGGNYCRNDPVSRAQMAVFLLKAEHGSGYTPPVCTGIFPDVPCPSLFADWIEQLFAEGITGGCGGGNYCPSDPVRRDQMAAFLLKAEHGSGYTPPACTGIFPDVPCPSLFADWIEQLFAEGITGGCGGGNYCPNNPNTRGQMAVFLVKTFGLILPGP